MGQNLDVNMEGFHRASHIPFTYYRNLSSYVALYVTIVLQLYGAF